MQPTKLNTKINLSLKVCLIVSCDISTNVLENSPSRIMQQQNLIVAKIFSPSFDTPLYQGSTASSPRQDWRKERG